MKMETIKNDILSLRGADVLIFGQKTTLPTSAELDEIDTVDIIDRLAPYEVTELVIDRYNEEYDDYEIDYTDSIDEYLDQLDEIYGLKEIEHNNSFNWLGRVSDHFDYTIYECGDGHVYVVFKVHRYGDVRTNYTEEALLKFNGSHEFYEAIVECEKYVTDVHPDYNVKVSALHDTMEVYTIDGDYVCKITELDELQDM